MRSTSSLFIQAAKNILERFYSGFPCSETAQRGMRVESITEFEGSKADIHRLVFICWVPEDTISTI